MAKLNNLSKNIIDVMVTLSQNEGLAELLLNDISNPFSVPVADKTKLINPKSELCRIFPYPFDPDATTEDGSFIRVYYNMGEFNENETIQEMNLHIDVIVAKSLWLINDGRQSLIRPYEIMDRIVDMIGKRSVGGNIQVKFSGWQHLAVNTKFDAIRLYSDYWNVEADNHYGM
jgi:hypothetical protein